MSHSEEVTEIYLVRHGQTEFNNLKRVQGHSDSPLSEAGKAQCERLGSRLAKEKFSALFSSDLNRALSSAHILKRSLNLEVEVEPGLRELSFGAAEGKSWVDINATYPEVAAKWKVHTKGICFPKGETREAAMERVMGTLEKLVADYSGKKVVAVTHGGVLATLFSHVLGIPSGTRPLCIIPNAGINVLRHKKGIWKIKTWGEFYHLD